MYDDAALCLLLRSSEADKTRSHNEKLWHEKEIDTILFMLPVVGLVSGWSGSHVASAHLRGTLPYMTADRWLAGDRDRLPLLHTPLAKMLLPGESATLKLKHAEELAALEAIEDDTIGCLLMTPHGNAISHTSLLEVREVRRRDVGAEIEVCFRQWPTLACAIL